MWTKQMHRRLVQAVLASLLAAVASAGEFRVAGYLPEYRVADFDHEAVSGLTDLIVFSAEPTPEGGLDLARLKKVPFDELHAFKQKENGRLILCIGGWGRSGNFAAVAESPEKRHAFAEKCLEFCRERKFDGVDLDWEFPQDKSQRDDYGELLRELRQALPPDQFKLSVTVAASQSIPMAAVEAVDWVQVMAYDLAGRHSTYEDSVKYVQLQIDRDIPPHKLVLGMPLYGRDVARRNRTLTYREILTTYRPQLTDDEVDGVYFNGPATIRRKTDYAVSSKLGGVMVWELGQDARGKESLLKVICERIAVEQQ